MGNTASGKPRTGFEWVTFFGFETRFALSKDDGRKLWREVDKNQVGFLMGADQCSVLIQHKLAEKLLALMVKSEHGKDRIAHKRKVQKKFNADRWERWLERAKKLILEDLGDAQGMAWFLRAAKYHDDLLTEENFVRVVNAGCTYEGEKCLKWSNGLVTKLTEKQKSEMRLERAKSDLEGRASAVSRPQDRENQIGFEEGFAESKHDEVEPGRPGQEYVPPELARACSRGSAEGFEGSSRRFKRRSPLPLIGEPD